MHQYKNCFFRVFVQSGPNFLAIKLAGVRTCYGADVHLEGIRSFDVLGQGAKNGPEIHRAERGQIVHAANLAWATAIKSIKYWGDCKRPAGLRGKAEGGKREEIRRPKDRNPNEIRIANDRAPENGSNRVAVVRDWAAGRANSGAARRNSA